MLDQSVLSSLLNNVRCNLLYKTVMTRMLVLVRYLVHRFDIFFVWCDYACWVNLCYEVCWTMLDIINSMHKTVMTIKLVQDRYLVCRMLIFFVCCDNACLVNLSYKLCWIMLDVIQCTKTVMVAMFIFVHYLIRCLLSV